jgi:hypothetical protein
MVMLINEVDPGSVLIPARLYIVSVVHGGMCTPCTVVPSVFKHALLRSILSLVYFTSLIR